MQAEGVSALIEDLRLRRIQIFRLSVAQDPAAEADDASAGVRNRKHDPVPEFFGDASPLVEGHEPARVDVFVGIAFFLLIRVKPAAPGEAETEIFHGFVR